MSEDRRIRPGRRDRHGSSPPSWPTWPAPDQRGIIVDSPPGAGKTTLVVRAAAELAASGESCIIVAQTNNQVNDLTTRLARQHPGLLAREAVGHGLHGPARRPRAAQRHGRHQSRLASAAAEVILATAAKWATVKDRTWAWAIIDEAYQMRSDMLLLIAARFEPGTVRRRPRPARPVLCCRDSPLDRPSLRPDAERGNRAPGPQPRPARSPAPGVLAPASLRRPSHLLLPSTRSPASGPLPPQHPAAGIHRRRDAQQRRRHPRHGRTIRLGTARTARTAHDPHRRRGSRRSGRAGGRLLARGAVGTCERHPDGQPLGPENIAIGVAHRGPGRPDPPGPRTGRPCRRRNDQGGYRQPPAGRRIRHHHRPAPAVRAAGRDRIPPRGRAPVRPGIPSPPRLHRRRPRRDSRRARRPPPDEPIHLGVPAKFPDGWEANQALLAHLAAHRVPV